MSPIKITIGVPFGFALFLAPIIAVNLIVDVSEVQQTFPTVTELIFEHSVIASFILALFSWAGVIIFFYTEIPGGKTFGDAIADIFKLSKIISKVLKPLAALGAYALLVLFIKIFIQTPAPTPLEATTEIIFRETEREPLSEEFVRTAMISTEAFMEGPNETEFEIFRGTIGLLNVKKGAVTASGLHYDPRKLVCAVNRASSLRVKFLEELRIASLDRNVGEYVNVEVVDIFYDVKHPSKLVLVSERVWSRLGLSKDVGISRAVVFKRKQ